MSARAGLVLGCGLISLGIALIDFFWRRRHGDAHAVYGV